MPRKPTGKIGPLVLRGQPNGGTGVWEKLNFPDMKEDIERAVLDLWIDQMRSAGGTILSATKNPESDFDFTLELPGGLVSLDLVEIIYRDKDGRPYESDDVEVNVFDFAEQ